MQISRPQLQELTEVIEDTIEYIYAKEPTMYAQEITVTHNEKAEQLNGRLAMLGVIAAIGAYAVTGQLIPGIFW